MSVMESLITGLTIVYSTVYSGADQRKHRSSASLALVRGIHRWPVNSPHKEPVARKMLLFDDVIMTSGWEYDYPTYLTFWRLYLLQQTHDIMFKVSPCYSMWIIQSFRPLLCFVVSFSSLNQFIHILQGCVSNAGETIRLSKKTIK